MSVIIHSQNDIRWDFVSVIILGHFVAPILLIRLYEQTVIEKY